LLADLKGVHRMVRYFVRAAPFVLSIGLCSCAGTPGSAPPSGAAQAAAVGPRALGLSARAPVDQTVTITQFTKGLPNGHSLGDITRGPDGSTMWFTDYIDPDFGADFVGSITPAGIVKHYYYNGSFPDLYGITNGPDGALTALA
jgi:hypothetical protein